MKVAPLPDNEADRLRGLRSYGVLDSLEDDAFDALVRVASSVCEAPISLITLIEEGRQWFLASVGALGMKETPRDIAFCAHALHSPELMVVEDTARDERFADNPLVVGPPGIRFYAGFSLIDRGGFALGTLCVADSTPRTLSPLQADVLRELGTAVVRLLEAKRADHARVAAEEAARTARADLDVVLDAASASVAYWDTELCNRFANRNFLEAFGQTRDGIRGRHAREVLGETLFASDASFWSAALRGDAQRIERTIADAAGKQRHVVVTFAPDVRDGRVHGFVSTENDVTELHAALALRARENTLLVLAEELAEVGHWRLEVEPEALYWSPPMYRVYGRDPATFVPSLAAVNAACHPDDRARMNQLVSAAVQRQETFDTEFRLLRPDGAIRHIESKGRCEVDPATGSTRALFGVFQDVTERRQLRERIGLQERLATVGTLAAGVGHEINNPLTYVSANLEVAIEEVRAIARAAPSARTRDLLELLAESRAGAVRIQNIVRGLRAFAREDEPLAPIDVRAAIEMAENLVSHELRSRVTLLHELGNVPAVIADEARLAQVLVSLLVNAAQAFSVKDPAKNRVVVTTRLHEGGRVAIEVADNGPGIASKVLPRIFDPFFTTKDVGTGMGLGLAISHNLVTSMGGTLTCETLRGEGTTFRVLLTTAGAVTTTAA